MIIFNPSSWHVTSGLPARRGSGFTLIEVMVAMAIFAVAGMVALNAYLASARRVQMVNRDKNFAMLSMLKIRELQIEKPEDMDGENGVFPEPFEDYGWNLKLSDLTIEDTGYKIAFTPYELEITTGKETYSVITPFLKTAENGESAEKQ